MYAGQNMRPMVVGMDLGVKASRYSIVVREFKHGSISPGPVPIFRRKPAQKHRLFRSIYELIPVVSANRLFSTSRGDAENATFSTIAISHLGLWQRQKPRSIAKATN